MKVLTERYGKERVVGLSSKDYDLMIAAEVDELFKDHKPEALVHLAGYSGGIGANRAYPADFYFRNTLLTAVVFDAASRHKVKKMVYPMGGCSYPAKAASPIGEDQMWNGYPQAESAPYSSSKKMGIVAAHSYRTQYGLNATVIIPGNLYGEYDNFHPLDSHVIPAMIRRYYEAKLNGAKEVVMWGSGRPTRDFVYAADVAATLPFFIEKFDETGPVNVSSGTRVTIKELAETIASLTGFQGDIRWDSAKPDGQMDKIFAVDKLKSLGLSCGTPLREGLSRTISWFAANYERRTDGVRL